MFRELRSRGQFAGIRARRTGTRTSGLEGFYNSRELRGEAPHVERFDLPSLVFCQVALAQVTLAQVSSTHYYA